ncbi:hypothetical protein [Chelatococcus reniformis]|uniref:Uncharacterized protein n=1 Tax=Chelatococcus reniformis TaxID=1494448 RepID=A0A916UTK1_9HYPH|nr:hypothetical protein [Chelatococcus reniformis]GGC87814.1 hypothetical protein GCM10010994_52250 [Chelatococcus reniformis]
MTNDATHLPSEGYLSALRWLVDAGGEKATSDIPHERLEPLLQLSRRMDSGQFVRVRLGSRFRSVVCITSAGRQLALRQGPDRRGR